MAQIRYFYNAINKIKQKLHPYKKVKTIDELLLFTNTNLDYLDLSALDLSQLGDMFTSVPTGPFTYSGFHGWTENVIWPTPDKMPKDFNPQKTLEESKHPYELAPLHNENITGHGINIAIIDNIFDKNHPEYKNNIKYAQGPLLATKQSNIHPHGSMVVGCAVGKNTGVAPDASIYYFTACKANQESGQEIIQVLKSVLSFNQKQLPQNRIHILSCSWSIKKKAKSTSEYTEILNLLKQIENMGIKIIICSDGNTEYKSSFATSNQLFIPVSQKQPQDGYPSDCIYIPTNEKTVPFPNNSYVYQKLGGDSSATPYLAGVYACALQGNEMFMTRSNWQQEIDDIARQTVTNLDNGGQIINPTSIRKHITQIVQEMNLEIIKVKSSQHE